MSKYDSNDEYEETMTEAEKAEREVYIKDMWKSHQQACVNSGFMTQTPAQFRENMRGFWRLNQESKEKDRNAPSRNTTRRRKRVS